jgi:hypothetical protein
VHFAAELGGGDLRSSPLTFWCILPSTFVSLCGPPRIEPALKHCVVSRRPCHASPGRGGAQQGNVSFHRTVRRRALTNLTRSATPGSDPGPTKTAGLTLDALRAYDDRRSLNSLGLFPEAL